MIRWGSGSASAPVCCEGSRWHGFILKRNWFVKMNKALIEFQPTLSRYSPGAETNASAVFSFDCWRRSIERRILFSSLSHRSMWTKQNKKHFVFDQQISFDGSGKRQISSRLIVLGDNCTTNTTGTTSGDKTDLSTGWSVSADCRWFTDVLMVTTTEWMVNGLRERNVDSPSAEPIEELTFIATPRTLGHDFRFALYLWYERPAFKMGLSIRPPPATRPREREKEWEDRNTFLRNTRFACIYAFSKSL